MTRRILSIALVTVLGAPLVGCQVERLFPKKVGAAVARLTVRNTSIITGAISGDTTCGFESPEVKRNFIVEGEIGGPGRVTWTVDSCEKDFGALQEIAVDCNGRIMYAGGRIVFSATKTIEGTLTGDMDTPVIPAAADSVKLSAEVGFDNFEVVFSDSDASLKMVRGGYAYDAEPHLAMSASTGVCAVSTSDLLITDVRYGDSDLEVTKGKRNFSTWVGTSMFSAQIGKWGERENWIDGYVAVWGKQVAVPNDTDDAPVLDAEYDYDHHVNSFMCKDDIADPLTYQCKSLKPALGHGLSRLTVSAFGSLAKAIDADARCGFSSNAVEAAATFTGELGRDGGSGTWSVSRCEIDFVAPEVASEDCQGNQRFITGRAVVSGTKTIRGIVSGDPEAPIIPTTRDPAEIELTIEFDEMTFSDSRSENRLTAHSGLLSGSMRPRTAKDTTNGVCSISTPVVAFEDLTWSGGDVTLASSLGMFRMDADASTLNAQLGRGDAAENELVGRITVDGEAIPIPVPGEAPTLDPEYDRAGYDASWACIENMAIPASDADCSLTTTLAENVARLLVQAAGTTTSLVNADTACGFENSDVQLDPTEVVGDDGEMGRMSWQVQSCDVAAGAAFQSADCLRNYTFIEGRATVDARRTVRGERESLILVQSIIPRARDAMDVFVDQVTFEDFAAWTIPADGLEPVAKLVIHSGSLTAEVHPVLGESTKEAGRYDIATPVVDFTQVHFTGVEASLLVGERTFRFTIASAQLSAMNGSYQGQGNQVAGTLILDGQQVTLSSMDLNPDYDQSTFDASYACTQDLAEPVPAR